MNTDIALPEKLTVSKSKDMRLNMKEQRFLEAFHHKATSCGKHRKHHSRNQEIPELTYCNCAEFGLMEPGSLRAELPKGTSGESLNQQEFMGKVLRPQHEKTN